LPERVGTRISPFVATWKRMVRWKHIGALSTKCAPLRQVEVENSAVALDSLNGFGNVRDECCDAVNAILGFLAYGAIHKFACERLRKRPALRRMRGLVVEHRAPFENRMLGDVIVFVPIEHSPLKEPVEDLSERIDISVDLGSICSCPFGKDA